MKKLFKLIATLIAVACVGSVIGQMIVIGVIWLKSGLKSVFPDRVPLPNP